MPGFHSSIISRIFFATMLLILVVLLYDSYKYDISNRHQLREDPHIWTIQHMSTSQQSDINHMIDNYFKRRSMNKSRYKKMLNGAREGVFRGAVGGCIMNGPAGIIPGAVMFGTMGAINSGVCRHIGCDDRNVSDIEKF